MTMKIERRRFMDAAIAAGAFTIVPRQVLGGAGYVPPSERINLAHIGMGTQGFKDIGELLEEPRIQIVSVCDPNRDSNDYIEWGTGAASAGVSNAHVLHRERHESAQSKRLLSPDRLHATVPVRSKRKHARNRALLVRRRNEAEIAP
jgi:hypothetical protein